MLFLLSLEERILSDVDANIYILIYVVLVQDWFMQENVINAIYPLTYANRSGYAYVVFSLFRLSDIFSSLSLLRSILPKDDKDY